MSGYVDACALSTLVTSFLPPPHALNPRHCRDTCLSNACCSAVVLVACSKNTTSGATSLVLVVTRYSEQIVMPKLLN
ncbi:hypothetical protein PUNSTDRAFT_114026 [Punctularia strigosozonata HHB-11173 SS5]|uniref:uncharacterized protein n=1 Tax=Punctularia strigosozonata (strain HHB-11173) TaxID=741275 RepID=UPI0004416FAC|nr:uncharacterized protein PUNSTDRAFT_114026 [Punctularia strigosozonata HHB-11173 SS5]EIN08551.1 hypothetical protein PUNSTDRAFT_114026 [Punctularia strigosozonata HHB-11173 SS5]